MKFALVLSAIVGMAVAAPQVQPRALQDDFNDILAEIPVDQITEIARKYIESDPEVQHIMEYLQSQEWADLVNLVTNHPTYIKFKEYLENALGAGSSALYMHDIVAGLPARRTRQKRSVQEMVNEIVAIIPVDRLLALIEDKKQNSPEFKEFWGVISGPEAYAFAQELRYLPEVERLAEELRRRGLEIDALAKLAYDLLGWEF